MPDVLRIVTLDKGGRPIEVLNLNSAPGAVTAYFRDREAGFTFTPAPSSVQYSKKARRYGGARAVGETHDNGSIGWTAYVRGTTLLAATQNVEALLAVISDEARGRYVEWAPEGGQSSFMEIAGPGSWVPAYNPVEFVQTNAMRVQLVFPILPLVRWARCYIFDNFTADSRVDYAFDAGTSTDVALVGGGGLLPVVGISLASERRARHTARGYDFMEGQVTAAPRLGTTLTGWKAGVLLRATSALNYIEAYIDDNGTVSRLRIDVVIAGVRTNRASINLAVRLTISNFNGIRARIEGNVVTADHFLGTAGSPTDTPNDTVSYTLVVGDAPLNTTPGKFGWSWIPQQAAATFGGFDVQPICYRLLNWPRVVSPTDNIPGTAPALADITVANPVLSGPYPFALIGWVSRPVAPFAGFAPFAVSASAGVTPPTGTNIGLTDTTNWASVADANALTGFAQTDATVVGVETYTAGFHMDPSAMVPDDFSPNEISIEVWGRMRISSTVASPVMVVSVRSPDGAAFGAERYTNEWGATGELLTGGGFYQIYRFGTITMPCDPAFRRPVKLWFTLTTGAGSTGSVAFDYIVVLPARSRALSPTGKRQDSTYPLFIASTSQTSKTILSDLSGRAALNVNAPMTDHGLGGSLIEVPPGPVDWLIKPSGLVPDDPVVPVANETLTYPMSFRVDITPRSFMLRNT